MKAIHYQDFVNKLDDIFQTHEKKTAIVEYVTEEIVRKYSYEDLFEYAMKVKLALARLNIMPKERTAVLAKPSAQSAMLLLALSYLGYTAVLTDVSLPVEEQNRLIHFTEPSAIITTEELAPSLDEELRTSLPILCLQGVEGLRLWNPEPGEWRKSEIPGSEDVIAIIFTSGTTGSMKGAEITYQAMAYSAIASARYAEYGVKTRFLHILPQTHVAGYAMLFINFLQGSEMAFVPEISAAGLAMGLRSYEPTHLVMIPKVYETIHKKIEAEIAKRSVGVRVLFRSCKALSGMIRRLTGIRMKRLMRPFYAPAFGRNIQVIGCGTAPCSNETVRFFLDLGICFLNVYGSTEESFPICSGNVTREKYPDNSAGNVHQFPFIDIKIEDGEVVVKSALEMKGYFRDPESTINARTADGYLRTGDLGYINEKGYLYVTGRRKETVQLGSGNKVSAADVDRYYQPAAGDMTVASCGIPDPDGLSEHLALFLETGNAPVDEIALVKAKIRKLSDATTGSYRLSEVFSIPKLPCTTVGKVKRFKLQELARNLMNRDDLRPEDTRAGEEGIEAFSQTCEAISKRMEEVCKLISSHVTDVFVTPQSRLSEDLNLDSLAMFEICSELETQYHVDLIGRLGSVKTVQELADLTESDASEARALDDQSGTVAEKYPLARKDADRRLMKNLARLTRQLYQFEAVGTEFLSRDRQYIFCPNHESHFDSLWVWAALENVIDCSQVACLAKQEHLEHAVSRRFLRMLGGIPTDRSGNPGPAMKRAAEIIREGKIQFLIHPEGTRTRNGELGTFKGGAAKLSLQTGVPMVPVCIIGAYQIYPAHHALPRLYDLAGRKRLRLQIRFGEPIVPRDGDTVEELTRRLRDAVLDLRESACQFSQEEKAGGIVL